MEKTIDKKEEYVTPELFELGDAAKLTQGGGKDCADASDFKMQGCMT